ncbi:uncharacterized protein K489DRAFT_382682 [Dissoconium aciculare CBS 342.82]|uniref:Uncharacterized protein n=1 Tax=Dissoconium aciculare CBS 342.82 TaxID=1314786 RepID=A0A6J3LYA1_9PEZI|nr:uncharacterized protein K489DRAFT_382682 [Dissoconium aciculare CBS 342.82]KAF1820741.1 hypothetical protein K489DRAFT_382682 [Dissoconium aciculare CBS 342.82]
MHREIIQWYAMHIRSFFSYTTPPATSVSPHATEQTPRQTLNRGGHIRSLPSADGLPPPPKVSG